MRRSGDGEQHEMDVTRGEGGCAALCAEGSGVCDGAGGVEAGGVEAGGVEGNGRGGGVERGGERRCLADGHDGEERRRRGWAGCWANVHM